MKKGLLVVFGLLLFASCKNETKMGFIDNSKLINDYQKKKDVEATFKTQIEAFDKRADSIGKSFQSQAAELQKTDPQLAKKESQQQYQMLGQQYQAFQQDMQRQEQDIQKRSQTEIDTLIKEVKKYVQEYGKKNGYTYILGSNDAGSVMYGDDSKDLTKEILDELNKTYKKK